MLAVSSGYKNDLVCAQHAVSLTSFNFTARVGFITPLLSECVCVSVYACRWASERGGEGELMFLCIYICGFSCSLL